MLTNDDLKEAIQLIKQSLKDIEKKYNLSDAVIVPSHSPPVQNNVEIKFNIRWYLPIPNRQKRPARIIILVVPREHFEDDGLLIAIKTGINGFKDFLKTFDPNHNAPYLEPPPEERYTITY